MHPRGGRSRLRDPHPRRHARAPFAVPDRGAGRHACADPDPEEPSSWTEYLLFNAAKGFVWLVESDEGWERVQVCDTWPSHNNASSVRWRNREYKKLYDYTSRVEMALGAFNWRVKVGDSTQITDYKVGTLKLTRELGDKELGWSASTPVSPAQLAQWFDRPELNRQKAMRMSSGKAAGGYRKWAKGALIAMLFLNFGNIFDGRFIPVLIGMVFLWLPALLADTLMGEDE